MKRLILLLLLLVESTQSFAEHFLIRHDGAPEAIRALASANCRSWMKEVRADAYTVKVTTFDGNGCEISYDPNIIKSFFTIERDGDRFPETVEFVTSSSDSDLKDGFSEILKFTEKTNDEFSRMWESSLVKARGEDEEKLY